MATIGGPVIPGVTKGLVLYLDAANEDSYSGTGTTWKDLSGNGNNGTLTNGPVYSGRSRGANFSFDGVNDYCIASCSIDMREDFSLGLFYYYDEYESNNFNGGPNINRQQFLLSTKKYWQADSSLNNGIWIGWAGNNTDNNNAALLVSFQANSLAANHVFSLVLATNDSWAHLFVTKTSSNIKIYRNGVFYSQINIGFTVNTDSYLNGQLAIGGYSPWGTHSQSKISTVSAYNRILTAEEILQNYNATKSRFNL